MRVSWLFREEEETDWAFAEIFLGLLVGHCGGIVEWFGSLGELVGLNASQDLNSWVR